MDHKHNEAPSRGGQRPSSSLVRLQRVLADAGVAARRVCEKLIEEGRVEVNGEVITRLPAFVDPRHDQISVDGKPIARQVGAAGRKLYIILHKPERTLTTASDEPGLERRTVLDLIDHPAKPRLFPVGRLGWDESGLVLLTNDGELANRLTHPRYGVPKTYLAVVKGDIQDEDLHKFGRQMFKLERLASRQEGRLRGSHVDMAIFKREPGKTTLRVTMKEGKNRYVAEVLGQSGFPVRKVAAVAIGPLQLRGLPLGSWRELTRDEIKLLRAACKDDATPEMKSGIRPDQEDAQNVRVPRQWGAKREGPRRPRVDDLPGAGRGTRGTPSIPEQPAPRSPESRTPQFRPTSAARTIRPPRPMQGEIEKTGNAGSGGVYIPPSRRERKRVEFEQGRLQKEVDRSRTGGRVPRGPLEDPRSSRRPGSGVPARRSAAGGQSPVNRSARGEREGVRGNSRAGSPGGGGDGSRGAHGGGRGSAR
ncbi:MAG TPA: pseudouridine synthase, partial [Phycisphaerales bacterium]|nr:pseudouridine synthase [Phycisphaerales bacterium]